MSVLAARIWKGIGLSGRLSDRQSLLMFAGTLLLSASLLFSVQPLFAKMVLPFLGGSPSVWAVAMCFFQAALLAGYCYAHALNKFVSAQWAPGVHLALCCAALLALPFGLPEWAHDVPEGNTYFWLIGVLTLGVGLPFFAVSANAPLLQAWFSRSGHPHADDPYFLYGASNLGSLASLLAYPFVIEPLLGLDTQTTVWTWGFCILTLMLAACGLFMLSGVHATTGKPADQGTRIDSPQSAPRVAPRTRWQWIGLAFVPSALLVAFTTHITTDIASAPFLWVIPLATFLGTFVIVFRDTPLISHTLMLRAHPYLVAASLLLIVIPGIGGVAIQAFIGFATFIVTTLVCHRELYQARPNAQRLTEFYLYMSLGGVLGGIFAALVAPQLFNSVAEYPLLIVAGLFARPNVCAKLLDPKNREAMVVVGGCALAGVTLLSVSEAIGAMSTSQVRVIVGLVSLALVAFIVIYARNATVMAKVGLGAATAFMVMSSVSLDGYNERSFFGVSRVIESDDGKFRLLVHGSTLHGGEKIVDENGNQPVKPPPVLYYHPGSPLARGFDVARATVTEPQKAMRVGVIGLGTGSLACHIKNEETIAFHEIDPVVVSIARNPEMFRYLSSCAPQSNIVVGDARLTIEKSKNSQYDYFVVDAFSSDAVPVHLLTREALALYASKVTDNGVIALHISNKHLELESVVAATAATVDGLHAAAVLEPNGRPGHEGNPSHVVFLSKDKTSLAPILAWTDGRIADAKRTRAWSDNYADILSALWRRYTGS